VSRGKTMIADRVVARIAARVAAECPHVGGVGRQVLGVPVGDDRQARAAAKVVGEHASAHVQLSVAYPAPVREVTREARQRIQEQVHALTGLTVERVDIDIATLTPERPVR
jgi:uncharacterized alkaline shock family protein YloU